MHTVHFAGLSSFTCYPGFPIPSPKMDANTRPATGPVRPSTRKREKKTSSKPYARPESKAVTTTTNSGMKRSDSQASLFGGLKSVFKSFFSGGDAGNDAAPEAEAESSKRTERSDDPDRTRSVDGDFEADSEDDDTDGEGDSFMSAPKRNGDGAAKRNLPSPEQAAQPSSKRLRRASPPRGMNSSMSLGYASPSLASLTRSQGIKRSGTLLDLDLRKSRPSSGTKAWSPWTEQAEAHERKARASANTGFARSGSIGYGLQAAPSPLRPSSSTSLFAPSSPARPRSVLHPLKSASLIRRSPSLPLGPVPARGRLGAHAMRDPYVRRETTALASSPVAAHHQPKRWRDEVEREQSPFVAGELPRDSSVLSGMSELVVREPTRPRESAGTSEMFGASSSQKEYHGNANLVTETQHKSEAERILATLASMRTTTANPTGTPGLSASYSSRTLRKQIAIPAPSDRREAHVPDFTGSTGLGLMKRAREVEGDSVMVSPYGKRRARGKIQVAESEESGEEDKGREASRMCE